MMMASVAATQLSMAQLSMAQLSIAAEAPPTALTLPRVLDSDMVLQRAPKAARLWGWAKPLERVTARLGGTLAGAATADAQGYWNLTLPPQSASTNHTLAINATSGGRVLTGVSFGDVFLCSGQSHMSFSINQDLDANATIGESADYTWLRMLTVGTDTSTTPLDDIRSLAYPVTTSAWLRSEPGSFGTGLFSYPSAICYYFGRELYTHFEGKVPIGLMSAAVGGSAIEFWLSDAARADTTCGNTNTTSVCPPGSSSSSALPPLAAAESVEEAAQAASPEGWTPGGFLHAMIQPLAPMALRGLLWDQGEADDANGCARWSCNLAALASSWRALFAQPDLLFTFDQLRSEPAPAGIGVPRLAAAIAPPTAFASRVDLQTCLPENTSAGHAVRKREVGRRLALVARVVGYAEPPNTRRPPLSFGPTIESASVASVVSSSAAASASVGGVGTAPGVAAPLLNVTVTLSNALSLHFSDAPECVGCCAGHSGGSPLITPKPVTGDGWSFGFADGSVRAVCKNASLGCDGAAHVSSDASSSASTVAMLLEPPGATGAALKYVVYGGTGPWLSAGTGGGNGGGGGLGLRAEQCVYPHSPRSGLEACALYNGVGGFDDHEGIAMAAQWWAA